MLIWGLHLLDLVILVAFLIAILVIGIWVSRGVKQESDFYLGGRRFGRTLQFFLTFGNSTDSTGAVQTSTEVYRQGVGGIWLTFQTLFITPFFWFTQPWFRRIRLVTMADLFVDRFNSKSLASAYACFNIIIALITLGTGNIAAYAVTAAMVQKPVEAYTLAEKQEVANYQEYQQLRAQKVAGVLPQSLGDRFQYLQDLNAKQSLRPSISYISRVPFYIAYAVAVALYVTLGGLKAAAITDAVQGILVLVMSVLLIPLGLYHLGGFHGLHASVPSFRFNLIGDPELSDYTWYSILAITFGSLVQILGLMHNMSIGGSATNEDTARFGQISGGFIKRIVIIAWMLSGLLAVGILTGNNRVDPDMAWGALSRELLPAGLMGLMLSGMLLGHMPAVGVAAVSVSALATRNLYEPLVKGKSQKHYLRVGQLAIGVVLALGIACALLFRNVTQALTMMITFNTFFGAAVFLIFFWRRLTASAIMIGIGLWVIVMGIVPWALPHIDAFNHRESLLVQTEPRQVIGKAPASAEDVAGGKANRVGDVIRKPQTVLPAPLFFDSIAREDPTDATSPRLGEGRFNVEMYLMYALSAPVARFSPAQRLATRWTVDGLLPFVMLIIFSLLTPRSSRELADRFYVKLKTPVAPTPEEDAREVEQSLAHPHRFDDQKLFPRSNWEFRKWTRKDVFGFFGCWGIVAVILLVLWGVLRIGA